MVTVFDLVTGETRTLTAKAAPRRIDAQPDAVPQVLPRLQEHTFTEPRSSLDLPMALAQLDCEVFIRSMEKP